MVARLRKVESKIGTTLSPIQTKPPLPLSRGADGITPTKLDLTSPEPVIIPTRTKGSDQDITKFRLFQPTYTHYWKELAGITKNPSSARKGKPDSEWCLMQMSVKYGIDTTASPSVAVLKEHVCHMATVAHLTRNCASELVGFSDTGLVPLTKKRKR